MIKGIGTDFVDLNRLREIVSAQYVKNILSQEELTFYHNLVSDEAKLTFLGGRLAAKEAVFKAIRTGKGSTTYQAFSVLSRADGSPYVKTQYLTNGETIHITIAHTDDHVVAFAVIELS